MSAVSRREIIGALALAGLVSAASMTLPRDSAADLGATLTPPEALAAAQSGAVLLVDIRRPDEWARTGIGTPAVPIDMRRPDFVEAVQAARASAQQPVALICARGVRSRRMTQVLQMAGLTPIIDIPEGMLGSTAGPGWRARGLPTRPWSDG